MHIRHILFVIGIVVVIAYSIFEARGVLFAPSLYIFEPTNGALLHTTRIHIAGQTHAGETVLINGREFIGNDQGLFGGIMTINPGYNEIGFLARDRFGNETRKVVKVVVE